LRLEVALSLQYGAKERSVWARG